MDDDAVPSLVKVMDLKNNLESIDIRWSFNFFLIKTSNFLVIYWTPF